MTQTADMSAHEMARAIQSRVISAVEATEAVLDRIDAECALNAFITVSAERALDEARTADATLAAGHTAGALHGVPFSVKDLTNTAGVRTTSGSRLMADFVPGADAVAVARARAAGAILVGKTTTPEFGHKPLTEGPLFGRTLNPWDRSVTCGGSSGGAGVAVAAGMGPLALGTDGGGSIRIPAACCGVVGFKATLGAVPNLQAPDLFGANSYVGPMARNVGDTRLMFDVIRGPDRRDPYGQVVPSVRKPRARPVRIGWLARCGNILDPQVERLTQAAIAHAADLGMNVEPVEIDFVSFEEAFLVILRSALLARLGTVAAETPELLDPTLLDTIDQGRGFSAADLVTAQTARTNCFAKLQELLSRVDVVASPTLSAPPISVDTDPLGHIMICGRDAGTIRGAWYPYTFPLNLTGHPAISIPCGLTDAGLPVGFQLFGRWHEDDLLLDVAQDFERAIGFTLRPPKSSENRRG
jgi:aspartyl-tRNA(Asn)/glutamyl-tRNA(Gln) amidotransferase subunit A